MKAHAPNTHPKHTHTHTHIDNYEEGVKKARVLAEESIDLQVRGGGAVPPLVHLLCDDGAAQRAALLPVEPQRDALVTEHMLQHTHSGRQGTRSIFFFLKAATTCHQVWM